MSLHILKTVSSSAVPDASIHLTLLGTVVTDIIALGFAGSSM